MCHTSNVYNTVTVYQEIFMLQIFVRQIFAFEKIMVLCVMKKKLHSF